ncbi:MepB family protein [Massilia pseudoviolaceinigra]|uniref:MepB family protein n=1 Tax=Massilia pseudoviolaceinigra TaxID=3057165 RepID=UPI00279664E8|nr:MepB family protein [Massilia sp. CCM 9206]MDQ1923771.1 MepB family protein [Massilia sp. CCM 9206]
MTIKENPFHPDLHVLQRAYDTHGMAWTAPLHEAESAEYAASSFAVEGMQVRFRVAKITPTKVGQFVTLWKRIGTCPIQPFDETDPVDLFVVSTRDGDQFGQFVFPKAVLARRDIVARAGQGGKRAIRVYPPWVLTTSKQAQATQRWQLQYFLPDGADAAAVRRLYGPL